MTPRAQRPLLASLFSAEVSVHDPMISDWAKMASMAEIQGKNHADQKEHKGSFHFWYAYLGFSY